MKPKFKSEFEEGYWAAAVEGQCRNENPYIDGQKRKDWFEGYTRWEQEEQAKDDDIARMGGEPS